MSDPFELPRLEGARANHTIVWGALTPEDVQELPCMRPRQAPDGSAWWPKLFAGGIVLTPSRVVSSGDSMTVYSHAHVLAKRSWEASPAREAGSKVFCVNTFAWQMDPAVATSEQVLRRLVECRGHEHFGERDFAPLFRTVIEHLRKQFEPATIRAALVEAMQPDSETRPGENGSASGAEKALSPAPKRAAIRL